MNSFQSFEFLRSQPIDSLNLVIEEYRHKATGAQHVHIGSDNSENVFLVALRTVPEDSKGVAHILEHTALCGSERYPVRDPFFMMIRRSLNTFMNAFTSSDWTAYPFASQSRKDYDNLLDVYLDAVFFPRLDPLDFAQEGHRLEFQEMENAKSPLEFKGVVFNEMKGAMSSPVSTLWHGLCEHLYPTTTYHHNSGGDPKKIPDLSYDELVQFHQTHYHPSNAIFMTFGDIPASENQRIFEERALQRFEPLTKTISVPLETRYSEPQRRSAHYAVPSEEGTAAKTHVVVSWLLGETIDLKSAMEAQLLGSVLLENSASPLLKALETSDIGKAPSPLCGLDDSQRELCFVAGLEGCDEGATEAVEVLIIDTLKSVSEHGVPQEQVEACLHQLELHQREITGDSYPYGLQLILSALNSATHRGDPVALLDLEPAIAAVREQIQDPDFIKQLCKKLLLENNHRVTYTLLPDQALAEQDQNEERARLDKIQAALSEQDANKIIELSIALQARQNREDDPSVLPKVELSDAPNSIQYPEPAIVLDAPAQLTAYATGTNGLVYQQLIGELPELDTAELALMPLLTHIWTELGVDKKSYTEVQNWQSAISGGISTSYRIQAMPDDVLATRGIFSLSGKALARNQAELTELMYQSLNEVRFDESERVRELISQARMRSESSITGNGHGLAMSAASRYCSPASALAYQTNGLEGIRRLKALDDSLENPNSVEQLLHDLSSLHKRLLATPMQLLLVGEDAQLGTYQNVLLNSYETRSTDLSRVQVSIDQNARSNEFWVANSQVNFCAHAYTTVPTGHPDAAPLTVLGGFLRNNFLHRAIREQGGAYGGGATQDNYGGAFRFYSYRDPRLTDTLTDFENAIAWLLENEHDNRLLEEAILGVVATLDKPGSPAGEARQAFMGEIFGRTAEIKTTFRDRVLAVTLPDLKRVAATYLTEKNRNTAVLTGPQEQAMATELSLNLEVL